MHNYHNSTDYNLPFLPASMNAWLVIFVLPVNSALNPIIYTLAAPTEVHRRMYKQVHKFLAAAKCQLIFSSLSGSASEPSTQKQSVDLRTPGCSLTNGDKPSKHPSTRTSDASCHSMNILRDNGTSFVVFSSPTSSYPSTRQVTQMSKWAVYYSFPYIINHVWL